MGEGGGERGEPGKQLYPPRAARRRARAPPRRVRARARAPAAGVPRPGRVRAVRARSRIRAHGARVVRRVPTFTFNEYGDRGLAFRRG